ncbi:MAG: hypothetical protein WA906_07855, partial [Pacificimonas sp.]
AQLGADDPAAAVETLIEAARIAEGTGDGFAAPLYAQAASAALLAADAEQAEALADRALVALGPDEGKQHAAVLIDRAIARVEQGQTDAARGDLFQVVRLDPENVTGWTLLAAAERRAGNGPGAESAIIEALKLAPEDPDVQAEAKRIALSN